MGSKKSTSTSSTQLPDWVTQAGEQATQLGRGIGSRQYEGYHGRRVADLSGNERQAVNLAAGGNGRAQEYVDAGVKLLSAGKNWDQTTDAERKAYEEPIFQATTRPAIDAANESYGAQKTNLGASEALIGAKGGQDAVNLGNTALDRNLNQTTGDITAVGRYNAYNQAQQQFGADQNRQRQVGEALVAAGGDISRLNAQQIQDLLMTGGAERVLDQQNLDFDYGQFLENRDWDITNLRPLLAALGGTQGSYEYSQTGTQSNPSNPLGQIIGLGTTLAGAYYGRSPGTNLGGTATGTGTAMSDFARTPGYYNPITSGQQPNMNA